MAKAKVELDQETEAIVPQDAKVDIVAFEGEDEITAEQKRKEKEYYAKKFRVEIQSEIRLGRKIYHPGPHTVTRDVAEVLREMDQKIKMHKLSVHIGKNYLTEKLIDGTTKITEVQDFRKLGSR